MLFNPLKNELAFVTLTVMISAGCELPSQVSGSLSTSPSPSASASGTSGPMISSVATLNVAGSGNIVVDSSGNIFYLDVNAGNIVKVGSNGSQDIFVSYGLKGGYGAIAIDRNNNLYVAANGTIVKVSPSGSISPLGGGIALQMTVDSSGNVYYPETTSQYVSTHIIKKVTPSGAVSTFAGSGIAGKTNANGTSASFNNPLGVTADSTGNIYVADAGNYLIRKITPSGDVTTFAGSGTQSVVDGQGTAASFYFRAFVHMTNDSSNNLYVGDSTFSTGYIRRITPTGTVTTFCGNGSSTDVNVPGPCNETAVWVNMGLAVAPNGAIYYVGGSSLFRVSN
jgi:sugar lactone lactonase YvrE